jgi:hypothetical protein
VVTHRSTNPAITCLYMAERTGCLVLTYLWSFVQYPEAYRLISLVHPLGGRGTLTKSDASGATLPSAADTPESSHPQYSRIFSPCLRVGGDPAVHREHAAAEPRALFIHRPSTPRYTRLQVRADLIGPSTNGEVFNKSSGHGLTLSSS